VDGRVQARNPFNGIESENVECKIFTLEEVRGIHSMELKDSDAYLLFTLFMCFSYESIQWN